MSKMNVAWECRGGLENRSNYFCLVAAYVKRTEDKVGSRTGCITWPITWDYFLRRRVTRFETADHAFVWGKNSSNELELDTILLATLGRIFASHFC